MIEDLNHGGVVARRYRNRRVGEFLKELRLTEGRGTGVPSIFKAMRDNGSPAPRFETDEHRSYFTTVLPIHPQTTPAADGQVLAAERSPEDGVELPDVLRMEPRRWEVLRLALTPQSRSTMQAHLGLSDAMNFRNLYLHPLIEAGLVAPTIPEKPRAPNQRYVVTARGRALLEKGVEAR